MRNLARIRGNLGMYSCVPRCLAKSSALVVALHGGQQTARRFSHRLVGARPQARLRGHVSRAEMREQFAELFQLVRREAHQPKRLRARVNPRHDRKNAARLEARSFPCFRDRSVRRRRHGMRAACFLSRFVRRRGNHRGSSLRSGARAIRRDDGDGFRAGAGFAGMGESGAPGVP
jgi:hypothetical protein